MPATELRVASALKIKAVIADVRPASEWLARTGLDNGVPQEQIGRLDLCLNEALANVISHGSPEGREMPVALHMEVRTAGADAGEATVVMTDEGPEFDVVSVAMPERPQTLAEAQIGGLGLLMIRSFSDTVSYQRVNGENVLTFGVRWA
jgi:serine/threonine-protein kinase RsbW